MSPSSTNIRSVWSGGDSIVLCPDSPELVWSESGGEQVLLCESDIPTAYGGEEASVCFIEILWIYAIVQGQQDVSKSFNIPHLRNPFFSPGPVWARDLIFNPL